MLNFFRYKPPSHKETFDLTFGDTKSNSGRTDSSDIYVSSDINYNYDCIKNILHTDINGDIKLRWFNCNLKSETRRGFVIFVEGLSNGISINDFILEPLMLNNYEECVVGSDISFFTENFIPQGQVTYLTSVRALANGVNIGNAVLFIDGCTNGVIIDVKSWEHRGVDSAINEAVVQGPHEAFNEVLRCNTGLIRKTLNCSDLVMETLQFGTISQTPASLAYIDGTINPDLLTEIKNKLTSIDADYILSVFDIEKIIEERSLLPMPQILSTERPDKVSRCLIEGRAALLLNGSSQALILPSNITDIIASPEDSYLRRPYSVFIKLIRLLAVFLSLLTPGIYLAMTTFHTEAILTDMLIALNSASADVPFSPLTEVIIMELAFELIKEAGVRIPGAIGSSLGIVGGLILGQSAVSAGLVSPIIIIIVSVCGIASFAIPSYSLSFAFRITRFIYIFAGAFLGIIGIICVLAVQLILVLGTKSFGVPSGVPFSPKTSRFPLFHAIFDTHSIVHPPSYLKSNKERKA